MRGVGDRVRCRTNLKGKRWSALMTRILTSIAIAAALTACQNASQNESAELVEQNCGTCHEDMSDTLRAAGTLQTAEGRGRLDRFLSQHHASDAARRTRIIEQLAARQADAQ